MPFLFGILRREPAGDLESLNRILERQAAALCRHHGHLVDRAVLDGRCGVGRVHLGILDRDEQPVLSDDGRHALCLAGEFYDRASLCKRFLDLPGWVGGDASLALALFLRAGWAWLSEANGQFSLALYDKHDRRLHLVTDRFGLRPVYCCERAGEVAFAGEVKAILACGGGFEVDPLSVREFFSFGQFLEDRTWIEGIRLLPPGSVTTVDEVGVKTQTYWSWDEIPAQSGPLDLDEAAEEMGRVWIAAVRRRIDDKRIGVLLSGGLDSRAVLAAIPADHGDVHCVTFGVDGCDDHKIAARVAAVRGAHHHFIPISHQDWLSQRLEAIWWTDGHLSVQHLHGIVVVELLRRTPLFDVHLHSFAGDLIFGGSYLLPEFLNARPRDVVARIHRKMRLRNRVFDRDVLGDHLARIVGKYDRTDAFFINNRVRRFTINGPLKLETCLFDRKPTFDNDAMTFCYSLPDEIRCNSKVYKRMLLDRFPEYYRLIPWQKTGLPITAGPFKHKVYDFSRRVARRVRRQMGRAGLHVPGGQDYTDYDRWTRTEPGRNMIRSMLLSPDARWSEHVPREATQQAVRDHFDGRAIDSDLVLLLLTFEVWLERADL